MSVLLPKEITKIFYYLPFIIEIYFVYHCSIWPLSANLNVLLASNQFNQLN
jgi:hypothetical protein